jgi:hypothetical protein
MALTLAHKAAEKEYPHYTLYRPKPNGGWDIDFVKLTSFLTGRGYYLYRSSIHRNVLIRVIDNIVKEVGKKDLKDEILNFITNSKSDEPEFIHQFFLKNIGKAVNDEFLETLPAKEVTFKKDLKYAMQIYYRNCIVKITKDKITTHPYTELDGYIWESQIIDRDFLLDAEPGSDFRTFVFNISNQEPERFNSICSMIGFMIHNYKNPAYCPAVILNDEVISDSPEGGTGKGILIKAIEQFMNTVTIEGKTFSFDSNFVYQRVNTDTKILSFQDVNKSFDFERLFSVLTDGISIEKKGKETFHMPFADAPKIVITTNYAIRGAGNSHERRRFELEISQYYNKNRTPYDEFKKMLFLDWLPIEWHQFDAFIVECCQNYLAKGLVKQELINLPEKRLMAETSHEFIEFMEDYCPAPGALINRVVFYEQFLKENPKSKLFNKTFYKYVIKYATFHKLSLSEPKSNGTRYFQF